MLKKICQQNINLFFIHIQSNRHNYGHGGSGVTICYGCAIEVANIAGEIMKNTKSKL